MPGTAVFIQMLRANRTLPGSAHKGSSSRAAGGGIGKPRVQLLSPGVGGVTGTTFMLRRKP